MSSNLGVWFNVPNGSKMEFWVEPDGSFSATGTYDPDDDQNDEFWSSSDLVPGPVTRTVSSDASYAVRIDVVFQGEDAETTTIHARVTGPDNNPLGSPYDYSVTGKQGDAPRRANLTIINRNANG